MLVRHDDSSGRVSTFRRQIRRENDSWATYMNESEAVKVKGERVSTKLSGGNPGVVPVVGWVGLDSH